MALPQLPQRLRDAGGEYLDQIRKLGLNPEACLWLYSHDENRFVLTLIWSGIDRYGPVSLAKLLFKAYNGSLVTRDIDPFFVDVRSPMEELANEILTIMPETSPDEAKYWKATKLPSSFFTKNQDVAFSWEYDWAYHLQKKARSVHRVRQDWSRFRQNVERLAA